MTDADLYGPPVHRLRYLLDYCQAKRIAPRLLTRDLANDQALADPLATIAWPDFLQVVVNSLQILPETEFQEAAAQYWQQPMNNHWIELGRSMLAPFDLLIDLIGDSGHLYQGMPIQVATRHRAQDALIVSLQADSDIAPNTALSELIAAEIKGFANAVGLTQFRIKTQPTAMGFELHCSALATARGAARRWLRRLNAKPLQSLRVTLQRQRRVESNLRKAVAQRDGAGRAQHAMLAQNQTNLERLLDVVTLDQFEIDNDNQLHPMQPLGGRQTESEYRFTYFDQLTARLSDSSRENCDRQLRCVRSGIEQHAWITLTALDPSQSLEMGLLLRRLDQNRVLGSLIPARPRTERSALTASKALIETLHTISSEAACLTNLTGTIEWYNRAFQQLTGSTEQNCVGRQLADFVPVALSNNQLRQFYQNQQAATRRLQVPAWFLANDGAKTPIQISAVSIGDALNTKKVYTFNDRSAVHERQQALDQAHRQLETLQAPAVIGEMTRGVAHDLGNLLTLVQIATEQIIKTSPRPLPATLSHLETAANDASTLTKTLLRPNDASPMSDAQCELVTLIQGLAPSFEIVLGPEMIFTLDLDKALGPLAVAINGAQLKNILLNLVINARDAMPAQGKLTLRVEPDHRWTDPETAAGRIGHLIEVTDNGAGIPLELQTHLFKPGFTTKGHRGGHGIGLNTIQRMIQTCGGNLNIGPGHGGGTRVRLWLPKAEKIGFHERLSTVGTSLPDKQRTALVVEPDEQLRAFLTLTLTALNFKVFSASDGQAGLDLYVQKSVFLDLVISELALPVLAGHTFLQYLYQTNPRQSVLILSVFIETQPHIAFLADKPWTTLTKPFSLAQVKTAIQQSLEPLASSRSDRGINAQPRTQ